MRSRPVALLCAPVGSTGLEQDIEIREVTIDRESRHAGLLGDRGDRCLRGTHGRVQASGRCRDPLARLVHVLGTPAHPIGTRFQ